MTTLLAALRALLDAGQIQTGDDIDARHFRDWLVACAPDQRPIALVFPRTTQEVSAVLRLCRAHGQAVVTQGGLTGLSGGATPVRDCVLLCTQRLRGIEAIDPAAATLTALAGTPLQEIQDAAQEAGLFFALDIGARGSCTIGGNAATNAGGNRVLRYGMTRELVLGMEAVLADGTIVTSMNQMLKNNAGYDLKQLFIGSEGTLGVITRLVLRLFPLSHSTSTAFCALPDYDAASAFLRRAKAHLGGSLSAFEAMWPDFYAAALAAVGAAHAPLPGGHGLYVLLESSGADPARDTQHFTALIEAAIEDGLVIDAVLAQSLRDSQALWRLRESTSEFLPALGPRVGFDISIPTGQIGAFVDDCMATLNTRWPELRSVTFGHVADGNIHLIVKTGDGPQPEHEIEAQVYDRVRHWRGSVSAEHGVGLHKKAYLHYTRTPEEIALMKTLKSAMDPAGILNPGKIFEIAAA